MATKIKRNKLRDYAIWVVIAAVVVLAAALLYTGG